MTRPEHTTNLAALLRKRLALVDAEVAPPSDRARADSVAALESALRIRARTVTTRRSVGIAVSLVAAAALVLVGARFARSGASPSVSLRAAGAGGEARLSDGSNVDFGDHVRLDDGTRLVASHGGEVSVAFATGTELTLADRGALALVATGKTQAFRLEGGSLSAHVAKLGAGERFLVRTIDAEVEVRGTRFDVSLGAPRACAGGATTRVHVTEGAVVVRAGGSETHLTPGETWPSCEDPVAPSPLATALPQRPEPAAAPSAPHASATVAAASASSSHESSLAQENELYQRALAAKRAGDASGAVASFERLLVDHPRSPLAHGAAIERMRLLAKGGPKERSRARAAARDYLARFPSGDAREEARLIVDGP